MSAELTIKIWEDNNSKAGNLFLDLIRIMNEQVPEITQLKNFVIRDSQLSKQDIETELPLSIDKIDKVLKNFDIDNFHFSVQSAIPCWRFEKMNAVKGFLPFWLELWGSGYTHRGGRTTEVEGNASLTFSSVGPFTALIENEEIAEINYVNNCVQENLQLVTDVIFSIIKNVHPKSVKAFTSSGLYQPLNAHLVYFKDATALQMDIEFIRSLWYNGLKRYRTPPLRDSLEKLDIYTLNPLRNPQQAKSIVFDLDSVIDYVEDLTPETLEKIKWDKYDYFEGNSGKIILEYPYWINSFVDNFYIDILRTLNSKI